MKRPNVVILVIDTLREDHSQGLERLRKLGFIKYENAIAPAPWTLPSHVSIITGLHPSQHGIHESFGVYVDREMMELSTSQLSKLNHGVIGELMDEGYNTYIISANPFLSQPYGFNKYTRSVITGYVVLDRVRSINEYESIKHLDELGRRYGYFGTVKHIISDGRLDLLFLGIKTVLMRRLRRLGAVLGLIDLTMDKGALTIINLLKDLTLNEPFLLLINIMEAHSPYTNKDLSERISFEAYHKAVFEDVIDSKAVSIWRREYPRHAKYAVNKALDIVLTLSRYLDNTLFVVTSDHGELLGDGGIHHGYFLKDGLLRVPLWVKWPSWFKAPRQVKPFVSLTEIPSMIRAVINNDMDYGVGSSIAISESFGSLLFSSYEAKYRSLNPETLVRVFSHRIRVYTSKCVFTYNESLDAVEDNGCEGSTAKHIIDVIRYMLNKFNF